MQEDGWITIGTKLDTKELEKELKSAKRKLEQYENDSKRLLEQKQKVKIDLKEYEKAKKIIEETAEKNLKFADTETGKKRILEKQKVDLQQLNDTYAKQLYRYEAINKKIKENKHNQALINGDVEELNEKLKKVKGFENIKNATEDVGKGIQKVTRRITKMAIAVFGIRSAFMFVRNAINTIANDDDQLRADIDYMKSALAYSLEPLVRTIVNLAKELMFYVGYIVQAWTGKNIFENANKGLEKANKQAKELQKTTASFDEMNVLSDSKGSNNATPSFNLAEGLEDRDVPKWIKWIADNGDTVQAILYGIAGGLTAIKLGLSLLEATGIGIALAGIVRSFQKIRDFMKDKTFKNFIGILEGIAIAVGGVAIALTAWPVAVGAAIALIVIELVNHFDEVKGFFEGLLNWIDKDFRGMMRKIFGPLGDLIVEPFKWAMQFIIDLFTGLFGGMKEIIEGIVLLFQGDFKGGIEAIFNGMLDILTAPFKAMSNFVQGVIDDVVGFFEGLWDKIKKPLQDTIKNINKTLDNVNPIKIVTTNQN